VDQAQRQHGLPVMMRDPFSLGQRSDAMVIDSQHFIANANAMHLRFAGRLQACHDKPVTGDFARRSNGNR
jgi:hypothetical protein